MKMNSTFNFRIAAAVCAALLFCGGNLPPLSGQTRSGGSELTRSMEQAIRLYHEGQDNEAMDRFMDILAKGSPSEKSLANDYISKITLRMNTGVHTAKDSETEIGTMNPIMGAPRPGADQKTAVETGQATGPGPK